MKLGIVGLPNVGKSTLFNALTHAGAESANYPFCTIDPNVGVVLVPDERLDHLREMYNPDKFTPAIIEFVDIAGLVRGASKGEGLGNKFLSHIREVDAIVHVVRCFEDDNIIHVDGKVDPLSDVDTINMELIFSDMEIVERRLERVRKYSKNDKSLIPEEELLARVLKTLEDGKCVRSMALSEEEKELLSESRLLTLKPVIYVGNIAEKDISRDPSELPAYQKLRDFAASEGSGVLAISAQIEAELGELEGEDYDMFLEDLGLTESGLDRLIKESYSLLGLISFLTAGEKEVRAWTIKKGTRAPQAAGKIHSDFERGFIRAEIVAYADLLREGTMAAVKEKGLLRSEGKDYVMQDGDVTVFRFNV